MTRPWRPWETSTRTAEEQLEPSLLSQCRAAPVGLCQSTTVFAATEAQGHDRDRGDSVLRAPTMLRSARLVAHGADWRALAAGRGAPGTDRDGADA